MAENQNILVLIQKQLDESKKLRHAGSNSQALTLLKEALSLSHEARFVEGEARVLGSMGLVYKNLGSFEEAVAVLRQSIDIHRRLDHKDDLAVTLNNLGSAFADLGRMEESLQAYEDAKSIYQIIGNIKGIATCDVFLGNAYQRLKRLEEAEEHYRLAEESYEQINDPINKGHIYANLSALSHTRGNLNATLEFSRRALDSYRSVNYIKGVITALNNIAAALMDMGYFNDATSSLEEALHLAENSGLADFVWRIIGNLAELYNRIGDTSKALATYQHAIRLLDDLRFQLQNRMNKISFLRLRSDRYADLIRYAASIAHESTLAMEYSERIRSRVLIEDLANSMRKPSHLPKDWLQQEKNYEAQITPLRNIDFTPATLDLIRDLSRKLESLWMDAIDIEPEYIEMRRGEPLSYHEIRLSLSE